ncbi:MAG: 23S rRNA (pseudouridine(1915)-N(3))-methyltransferase RlmH, partial [Paludibacteraceae bacterium]|nr:23S rRNA (pseudouridine(1915)-N(3))-methyltransferase RlmH [Paludibacteraceae bacterium]
MKVTLIVVGKTVGTELPRLIDTYTQRLKHYVPFDIQVIPDLKNTKNLSEAQQKQQEGEAILRAVEGSYVVLLDEHGIEYRSMTFARQLQTWMNTSARGLTFVIGGAYGFSPAVYERADAQISLSQMTFSHQMIRLLFVEQLYRAMTILRGEPYHH